MTQEQYQLLCQNAKACGLSKRAYFIQLIEGKTPKIRQSNEIRALRTEIHQIGNNINQIARSVNTGVATPEDANYGIRLLDKVYALMYEISKR